MNWVVGVIAIWIFADGVGSIRKYRYQSRLEHFVRVLRAGAGLTLIVYSAIFL